MTTCRVGSSLAVCQRFCSAPSAHASALNRRQGSRKFPDRIVWKISRPRRAIDYVCVRDCHCVGDRSLASACARKTDQHKFEDGLDVAFLRNEPNSCDVELARSANSRVGRAGARPCFFPTSNAASTCGLSRPHLVRPHPHRDRHICFCGWDAGQHP
jgi:hypothetical protein